MKIKLKHIIIISLIILVVITLLVKGYNYYRIKTAKIIVELSDNLELNVYFKIHFGRHSAFEN